MKSVELNRFLSLGHLDVPRLFPHLESLKEHAYVFEADFGLPHLPTEPGFLLIRGPRQYGKSTWLESQMKRTIVDFGPGTAFYVDGDECKNEEELHQTILGLVPLFSSKAGIKRLFVDEITAVPHWEKALKRLLDRGELRNILVVSTGSKAADLRRGAERLPGRKGNLSRTTYIFTPVSFKEFESKCGDVLGAQTGTAYLMSGGCPLACNALATQKQLPEYITALIRDWIYGECAASGRSRESLMAVLDVLIRGGGNPMGHLKLAREAGLANNTVAAGYVDLLGDLMVLAPSYAWDASLKVSIRRKPAKFHFINTLAALTWHPAKIRTLAEFEALDGREKAKFYEWLTAQEIWRRRAIRGEDIPESLNYWRSDHHEIDFVLRDGEFLEVKSGPASVVEFSWFPKIFPKGRLRVVQDGYFESDTISGIPMTAFLREPIDAAE